MSRFGEWLLHDGLPVFCYRADQRTDAAAQWQRPGWGVTTRHWACVGNQRIQLIADNEGLCGLWDTQDGLRWLTAADDHGTGLSVLEAAGLRFGTAMPDWPDDAVPDRQFGPTWFTVRSKSGPVTLERATYCPEGEQPWVLVRVSITNASDTELTGVLTEEWELRPRFAQLGVGPSDRRKVAEDRVAYQVETAPGQIMASEVFSPRADEHAGPGHPLIFGSPRRLVLEGLASTKGAAVPWVGEAGPHPVLRLSVPVQLPAGQRMDSWFRFGEDGGELIDEPAALLADWTRELRARLPTAAAARAPEPAREIPWHAALLTGGACTDAVLGGHTLDQASAYSFELGFNGAARDPLQHALPLVYIEPALALSVLRNTLAWSDPDGRLPWALDGAKQPRYSLFDPSDQALWALWLAAEYAAATGDLASFPASVPFHPSHWAGGVSLHEALRRQFRYFADVVGRGEHGHVRIMNADWNDLAISESGADRTAMIAHGESVLNSAMAAWVLPVWAALAERLGDHDSAAEARSLAGELRQAVAGEWNGRWFRRAYAPGVRPVGEDEMWLEVQPWAILCGAADEVQARSLLAAIDAGPRAGSPLGARVKWPAADGGDEHPVGEGTRGGIWYSINMTLVWAAQRLDPALAWDEWRRMTLAAHAARYPDVWEGTISGPDSYNSPESSRPGRTWAHPGGQVAMQAFPVGNQHSHGQPILSYLRLLGVEPTASGTLRVAGGAAFASRSFEVRADGHGWLRAFGDVTVEGPHLPGPVRGTAGEVLRW